jgi:DTW domain-containing protein YfiP
LGQKAKIREWRVRTMDPLTAAKPLLSCSDSAGNPPDVDSMTLMNRRRKRPICAVCDRPKDSACICAALPSQKIQLDSAYCIILQHPNEAKQHQNRSLPFIENCIDSKHYLKIVGRRFPSLLGESITVLTKPTSQIALNSKKSCDNVNPSFCSSIHGPNDKNRSCYVQQMSSMLVEGSVQPKDIPTVWLLSPNDKTAISLTEALKQWEKQKQHFSNDTIYPKIVVLVMDATWKYAKEMDRANILNGSYPTSFMQRIQLTPSDFDHPLFTTDRKLCNAADDTSTASSFHRFSIRTPPKSSSNDDMVYLSTAECIAYVLARIELQDEIYSTIMKPLDLMVRQWQAHCKTRRECETQPSA